MRRRDRRSLFYQQGFPGAASSVLQQVAMATPSHIHTCQWFRFPGAQTLSIELRCSFTSTDPEPPSIFYCPSLLGLVAVKWKWHTAVTAFSQRVPKEIFCFKCVQTSLLTNFWSTTTDSVTVSLMQWCGSVQHGHFLHTHMRGGATSHDDRMKWIIISLRLSARLLYETLTHARMIALVIIQNKTSFFLNLETCGREFQTEKVYARNRIRFDYILEFFFISLQHRIFCSIHNMLDYKDKYVAFRWKAWQVTDQENNSVGLLILERKVLCG